MRASRTIRADELSESDIGKRVRFNRPPTESGRPIISGRLDGFHPETYIRGNMPRPGFILTVSHQTYWGGMKGESFGPVQAAFQITVGGQWEVREPRYLKDHPEDDDE